jgi:hypothetical protein
MPTYVGGASGGSADDACIVMHASEGRNSVPFAIAVALTSLGLNQAASAHDRSLVVTASRLP